MCRSMCADGCEHVEAGGQCIRAACLGLPGIAALRLVGGRHPFPCHPGSQGTHRVRARAIPRAGSTHPPRALAHPSRVELREKSLRRRLALPQVL